MVRRPVPSTPLSGSARAGVLIDRSSPLVRGVALLTTVGALGACRPPLEFYPSETVDVYQQEALRAVDVLLVIDNSGSMEEEQDKLAANFQGFIQAFTTARVDYHIGVITTDVYDLNVAGLLQGEVRYITPETEDAEAVFAENVRVGTNGSGLEMGFQAAQLALSQPLLMGYNAGFYRSDASLSIMFFSDENDLSPGAVDDYLNYFGQLKGEASYRDHSLMKVSGVVGDVPYGCEAEDGTGEAGPGSRYVDAVTRTEGIYASICASDFSPIVQALGLDASGLKDRFPLTRCPKAETLEVTVEGREERAGVEYEYLSELKMIQFRPQWVPGPGEEIVIRYEFYPDATETCPEE